MCLCCAVVEPGRCWPRFEVVVEAPFVEVAPGRLVERVLAVLLLVVKVRCWLAAVWPTVVLKGDIVSASSAAAVIAEMPL